MQRAAQVSIKQNMTTVILWIDARSDQGLGFRRFLAICMALGSKQAVTAERVLCVHPFATNRLAK